jgi:hemoglobin
MFDRYGGFACVSKIVMAFYDRVLDSDIVGDYFEDTDMKSLIDHQTKFISSLMGGPASYTNDVLQRVHAGLNIDRRAFDEVISLLTETLEDFDFRPEDVDEIRNAMESRASVIISA